MGVKTLKFYSGGDVANCCGLEAVQDMVVDEVDEETDGSIVWTDLKFESYFKSPPNALLAVTNPTQDKQGVGKRLKKNGFKVIKRFKGTHGTTLKIWFRPKGK